MLPVSKSPPSFVLASSRSSSSSSSSSLIHSEFPGQLGWPGEEVSSVELGEFRPKFARAPSRLKHCPLNLPSNNVILGSTTVSLLPQHLLSLYQPPLFTEPTIPLTNNEAFKSTSIAASSLAHSINLLLTSSSTVAYQSIYFSISFVVVVVVH